MTYRVIQEDDLPYGAYFYKDQAGSNQANYSPGAKLDDHEYSMSVYQGRHGKFNFINTDLDLVLYAEDIPCVPALGVQDLQFSNNDDLKLINKMNTKIRGSAFNGSNFLIEGNQVVNLLTTNATRIARFLHFLRHGRVYDAASVVGMGVKKGDAKVVRMKKLYNAVYVQVRDLNKHAVSTNYKDVLDSISIDVKKKRILEDASSLFLEYRYGVEPLWNDLHDSMLSLAQRTAEPERTRFKARRKIVKQDQNSVSGLLIRCHLTAAKEIAIVLGRPPSFSDQLAFNDVRSAMWEYTPWSFIVDWALPVQQWLGALDFAQTWDIIETRTTYITKQSALAYGCAGEEWFGFPTVLTAGSELPYSKSVVMQRTLGNLSFSDALQMTPEVNTWEKTATIGHVSNAIALLTQGATSFGKSLKF